MGIAEIQELLAREGERRRHLGLLLRRQIDDDWNLASGPPKSEEDES
jgi:hypothetical protein